MDVRFSLEDGGVEFSLKNGHVGPQFLEGSTVMNGVTPQRRLLVKIW